jgi:GDP-L-fucose synthase
MLKKVKIFLAGHEGLVGSAVLRQLKRKDFKNILLIDRKNLDFLSQEKVNNFFSRNKPSKVIICAAKVGGIVDNFNNPAVFYYENSMIQNNLIHASYVNSVKDLIFLGSSCIYPRLAEQPIKESCLLRGKLEITNQSYAIAKISGIEMCRSYNKQYNLNYKCLMPANLYGPCDNYNLKTSHFFASCIRKIYSAKKNKKKVINFIGTGKSKREALFVDDLAEAIIFFLNKKTKHYLINVGSGFELSIKQYVSFISSEIGYNGDCNFNNDYKMDGTPRKIVDTKIARSYGWQSKFSFKEGLQITIQDFINNYKKYTIF